jgi:hypothetical protein
MTEKKAWEAFFDAHAPVYEENVFTKNTVREVDFLLEELSLQPGDSLLDEKDCLPLRFENGLLYQRSFFYSFASQACQYSTCGAEPQGTGEKGSRSGRDRDHDRGTQNCRTIGGRRR